MVTRLSVLTRPCYPESVGFRSQQNRHLFAIPIALQWKGNVLTAQSPVFDCKKQKHDSSTVLTFQNLSYKTGQQWGYERIKTSL